VEQIFRQGRHGPEIRPFCTSAEVECRQCSEPLERAIVDFGADTAGGRIPVKLKEHYGIEVPASTCWQIVLRHARAIQDSPQAAAAEFPDHGGVAQLIVEVDGSMIPIVETAEGKQEGEMVDRRKTRTVGWKEARLSLVREAGSVTPVFAATMGTAEEAGEEMFGCAVRAGAGLKTKMHCVGDGAPWIADQVDLRFGSQGSFLVDFYHLCEYLAPAGDRIVGADKNVWMKDQEKLLKENHIHEVLEGLQPFLEGEEVCDANAPVRVAYRYMTNRPGQFDYRTALNKGLPIGSGEVESAHRYVIQARLKLAGAWWKIENARSMLALRVLRANGEWDHYWRSTHQEAA